MRTRMVFYGRDGEALGLFPPEEGSGLASAGEGQAKLGFGIHPVTDGIAVDASGMAASEMVAPGRYQRQHLLLRRGKRGQPTTPS